MKSANTHNKRALMTYGVVYHFGVLDEFVGNSKPCMIDVVGLVLLQMDYERNRVFEWC
jgi:hypothetical protein